MHLYLFISIVSVIVTTAIILLICMTKNKGKNLYDMADIFETDIFSDISCFNDCLEECIVTRVPELSDEQKLTCEQECGTVCGGDTPSFRF